MNCGGTGQGTGSCDLGAGQSPSQGTLLPSLSQGTLVLQCEDSGGSEERVQFAIVKERWT